jgi:chaperonin GroES
MKIKPLTGQCLLKVLPQPSIQAGLHLPDIAHDRARGEKEKPFFAQVLEVGPWPKVNGFSVLPEVAPGDKVLVTFYAGTKLRREIGENLRLCPTDDILAKFF